MKDAGMNETTEQGADDAGAEEAAHLMRLQQGAAQDAAPGGPDLVDTAAEPTPSVNLEAEIAALARVAVAMLGPMFPSLREVYTDEAITTAASVTAPLCRKHGWLPNGIGGRYAEEIAAAAVLAPLAVATYAGVRRDLAESKRRERGEDGALSKAAELAAPAPQQAQGSKAVTFGASIPEGAA